MRAQFCRVKGAWKVSLRIAWKALMFQTSNRKVWARADGARMPPCKRENIGENQLRSNGP